MHRPTRRAVLAALPVLAVARQARAASLSDRDQPHPQGAVLLVVPFSAGGAADITARILARHVQHHLPDPQPVIQVENRAGASGAVGTQSVARAHPDGQTLLLARVASSAILPATDPRTPYAWDDFTMLGLIEETPFVLSVRSDAPWDRLADLIGALREQPGQIAFATTGPATLLDLGIRQMFAAAGLPIDAGLALPFRGGGDAVAALLDGRVQFVGTNLSEALVPLQDGRLRGLMIGTTERLRMLPAIPTAREVELPGLASITGWSALFGPPGMAEDRIGPWVAALASLREDTAWQAATRSVGALPRLLAPTETRAYVAAQVALYRDLGRRLGLL